MKVESIVEQSTSKPQPLMFGIPHGYCAGPVICSLYIPTLNRVVQKYPADLNGYADDHMHLKYSWQIPKTSKPFLAT